MEHGPKSLDMGLSLRDVAIKQFLTLHQKTDIAVENGSSSDYYPPFRAELGVCPSGRTVVASGTVGPNWGLQTCERSACHGNLAPFGAIGVMSQRARLPRIRFLIGRSSKRLASAGL